LLIEALHWDKSYLYKEHLTDVLGNVVAEYGREQHCGDTMVLLI
jgi:hypothetical protein